MDIANGYDQKWGKWLTTRTYDVVVIEVSFTFDPKSVITGKLWVPAGVTFILAPDSLLAYPKSSREAFFCGFGRYSIYWIDYI